MRHRIQVPPDATDAQMAVAYAAGLLRKEQLVHGQHYEGQCRNAFVARWHGGEQCFVHWRTKYGDRFLERIKHPVDEPRFDVFLVTAPIEPNHQDAIPDDMFEAIAVPK